ncbi:MAG: hypothetical protein RSC41_04420 [Oscillospiraceae bacterium]
MKNIVFIGLVSFFTDISTEMVYPLIPLYLTAAFGATPAFVGFIEGGGRKFIEPFKGI